MLYAVSMNRLRFFGRRTIGTRGSRKQYIIGLPTSWVREHGLKQEDLLDIYIEGDRVYCKIVQENRNSAEAWRALQNKRSVSLEFVSSPSSKDETETSE